MSVAPLITFKAGQCEEVSKSEGGAAKIKCLATPGYVYVYIGEDDELVHFCWRPRSEPASNPDLDLIMFPGDARFIPYTGKEPSESGGNVTSPTDGRIFSLKFSSSSQRHLFWMQSKTQHPEGNANWFSQRDQRLGQIVDLLLSGNDVDVEAELQEVRDIAGADDRQDDDDQDMEDAHGGGGNGRFRANSTGGAGAGATGGDIREEGEESREGGADGGRA